MARVLWLAVMLALMVGVIGCGGGHGAADTSDPGTTDGTGDEGDNGDTGGTTDAPNLAGPPTNDSGETRTATLTLHPTFGWVTNTVRLEGARGTTLVLPENCEITFTDGTWPTGELTIEYNDTFVSGTAPPGSTAALFECRVGARYQGESRAVCFGNVFSVGARIEVPRSLLPADEIEVTAFTNSAGLAYEPYTGGSRQYALAVWQELMKLYLAADSDPLFVPTTATEAIAFYQTRADTQAAFGNATIPQQGYEVVVPLDGQVSSVGALEPSTAAYFGSFAFDTTPGVTDLGPKVGGNVEQPFWCYIERTATGDRLHIRSQFGNPVKFAIDYADGRATQYVDGQGPYVYSESQGGLQTNSLSETPYQECDRPFAGEIQLELVSGGGNYGTFKSDIVNALRELPGMSDSDVLISSFRKQKADDPSGGYFARVRVRTTRCLDQLLAALSGWSVLGSKEGRSVQLQHK